MASKSFVQQTLGTVVQATHAALTKPLGYRKQGRSLALDTGELFHVINFQGSAWWSAESGQFTINLSVAWPYFHDAYLSQPMPSNPASAQQSVMQRIGFLMPERRDFWWHIDRTTKADALIAEMQYVLKEFAFPFLARFSTVALLVAELRQGLDVQAAACSPHYLRAAALAYAGDKREAAKTLRAMLSPKRLAPWDPVVEKLLHKLGLDTVH